MRRLTRSIFLILFILISNLTISVWAQSHPVKIGAILTLSGNFISAGDDSRRGIEAALNLEDNGDYLDIQYEDSRNEPAAAIRHSENL